MLRNDDLQRGLLYDAPTLDDVLSQAEAVNVLDGIVVDNAHLKNKMLAMRRVMNMTANSEQQVVGDPIISEPFMRAGTAQVAVIFSLVDGQAITIYFHNPDADPKRIKPTDELVCFKFLLNKKDITIVVAPENGRDIDLRQVAMRIMKLAAKNSVAFQRQNQKNVERKALIDKLEQEIANKKALLSQKLEQIETLEKSLTEQAQQSNATLSMLDGDDKKDLSHALDKYSINSDGTLIPLHQAAHAYFKENLQGTVVKTVIGDVHLLGSTWQKMKMGTKEDELKAKLIPFVPKILNGTYEGAKELTKQRNDNFIRFHSFKDKVLIDGLNVEARILVGETPKGDFLFKAYSLHKTVLDSIDTLGMSTRAVFRDVHSPKPSLSLSLHEWKTNMGYQKDGGLDPISYDTVNCTTGCNKVNNNVIFLDNITNNEDGWNIEIISVHDKDGNEMKELEDKPQEIINTSPDETTTDSQQHQDRLNNPGIYLKNGDIEGLINALNKKASNRYFIKCK